jgi:hypothetical protein
MYSQYCIIGYKIQKEKNHKAFGCKSDTFEALYQSLEEKYGDELEIYWLKDEIVIGLDVANLHSLGSIDLLFGEVSQGELEDLFKKVEDILSMEYGTSKLHFVYSL